jgi:hypothetical protein
VRNGVPQADVGEHVKALAHRDDTGTVFEGFRVNATVTKAHLEQEAG